MSEANLVGLVEATGDKKMTPIGVKLLTTRRREKDAETAMIVI